METNGEYSLNTAVAPLVSCVMVTGKSLAHEELARNSVNAFLAQNYPNKELIIINDGDYQLGDAHPLVTEYCLPADPEEKLTLGGLRNLGLDHANGDWICQWDDDDYCHPHRLAYQMSVRREDCCVLLLHQIRYSFKNNSAYVCTAPEGHAGTILHPQTEARYPEQGKAEDSVFWTQEWGDARVVLDNNNWYPGAALYLRFFHEHNTWDEQHIMKEMVDQQDRWLLNSDERFFLENVLERYPSFNALSQEKANAKPTPDAGPNTGTDS